MWRKKYTRLGIQQTLVDFSRNKVAGDVVQKIKGEANNDHKPNLTE